MELDKSPSTIATLFNGIAPVYDRVNSLLSLNLHKGWNKSLVHSLLPYLKNGSQVLDLCAGTGAIAKELLKYPDVHGVTLLDVSPGMLALAKGHLKDPRATFVEGDALKLPFKDSEFDAVTVAYGIRNLPSLEKGFHEVRRVLKPHGTFAILELTRPKGWMSPLHNLYLKGCVPLLGRLASGKSSAYHYLSSSVADFLAVDDIVDQLHLAGFKTLRTQPLFKGCATLFLSC
jgi:demethylmenaquinone methyltransferase/2-methoxy-6-polyprenyl-1,4-benzoquinol methylase